MIVNFEFLCNEPIENIITCMHFKVDKVVFFGYHDTIVSQHVKTENFLKKYCGVQKVVFLPLSQHSLQSVLKTMRKEICYELSQKAKIFLDITGGDSLSLVALGMLSKEFDIPLHMYDVPSDKLIELENSTSSKISEDVMTQKVALNLDRYIEMHGGIINYKKHKDIKFNQNEEFTKDISKIWLVAKKYIDYWNPFSDFLREYMIPDEELFVNESKSDLVSALNNSRTRLNSLYMLNTLIDDLTAQGLLLNVNNDVDNYRFKFKNQDIKDCLWEGGSILELNTYLKEKMTADDCKMGVHLDWDGVIHNRLGVDVLNEIDVLTLCGNVITFISCKSGKMEGQQALHALYELDTVARRFGGKYAKKVLVTAKSLADVYISRADEMDIEVRC